MLKIIPLALSCVFLITTQIDAQDPQSNEDWLAELRGSGTYREGLVQVRKFIDAAYDLGAVAGASYFADLHDYYMEEAQMKGCETGTPLSEGPVKACHRVRESEPRIDGALYDEGRTKAAARARETAYPERIEKVLVLLFDYGYVHGLKHGLRADDEGIRWKQAYYRACMSRANSTKNEPVCASSAEAWVNGVTKRLKKRIDAHASLPSTKSL